MVRSWLLSHVCYSEKPYFLVLELSIADWNLNQRFSALVVRFSSWSLDPDYSLCPWKGGILSLLYQDHSADSSGPASHEIRALLPMYLYLHLVDASEAEGNSGCTVSLVRVTGKPESADSNSHAQFPHQWDWHGKQKNMCRLNCTHTNQSVFQGSCFKIVLFVMKFWKE